MRPLLVCPDDFLARILRSMARSGEPPLFLVRDRFLRALRGHGQH